MNERGPSAVNEFMIDLASARRLLQFYPANNSRVRESLSQVDRSFRALVESDGALPAPAAEGLLITVDRNRLFWNSHEIDQTAAAVERFGTDLYKLQVKSFHISPAATRDSIERFLEATCKSPDAVREQGGFERVVEALEIPGIEVVAVEPGAGAEPGPAGNQHDDAHNRLDMLDYLRIAQALRQPGEAEDANYSPEPEASADLDALSAFFDEIAAGSEEKMGYFLQTMSDPERLRRVLQHIYDIASVQPAGSGEPRPLELLRSIFSEMLAHIRGFPTEVREDYVRHIGMAVIGLPPVERAALVRDGLGSEAGNGDIADAILARLPEVDVAEALLHAVRFYRTAPSAIENFLSEFIVDVRRRNSVVRLIARLSTDDDSMAISELLDRLSAKVDALTEDEADGRPPLDVDQAGRQALNRMLSLDPDDVNQLGEFVEADLRLQSPLHAARTLLELYLQPTIAGVSKQTSERLHRMFVELLEDGRYDVIAEIVAVAERDLPESAQARIRPELEPILDVCTEPQHINRILSAMRKAGARTFEYAQLLYLLQTLGERAIEHLFLRLEMEHSRPMRMFFLDLFGALGDDALPLLKRKMNHRDWFVVRNVVYIFGRLASDEAIHSLILLLDHHDMRVRREVVRALAKIGGTTAEQALIRLLDDDEPAMRRIAAEWLGYVGCHGALPELRERLARAIDTSQDEDTQIGLIHALGRLGTPEDVPLVRRAVPKMAFFASDKKRELGQAAKEALERLEVQPPPARVQLK